MTHLKLNYIPTKYILKRCRKNIKRKYTVVRSNFQDLHGQLHSVLFDKLCHKFFELAEVGAETEDNCELLMGVLEEWKEKIVKRGSICASNVPADSPSQIPRSFEESRVTSPQAVHRKGRAPFKRKMSRVEQVIRRKKETAKKVTQPTSGQRQLLTAFQPQQQRPVQQQLAAVGEPWRSGRVLSFSNLLNLELSQEQLSDCLSPPGYW